MSLVSLGTWGGRERRETLAYLAVMAPWDTREPRERVDQREREAEWDLQDPRVSRVHQETRDCLEGRVRMEREEGRECEVPWVARERREREANLARLDQGGWQGQWDPRDGREDREPLVTLAVRDLWD